ncbi:MAG: SOS response-associated peptidase family protein [Xanthomonadales bacterium]|nr:SOS response-associated peptidase family protein [Xanthomonadales bacterium]
MCGKASVHIKWKDVYAWASSLTPPGSLPEDPEPRVNVSPSRLRRKSEPESMEWESLPVVYHRDGLDRPAQAIWPFIPHWAENQLPRTREGKLLSTANARLRTQGAPFAPTFMAAWKRGRRVVVFVSWFYEFDARVRPQVPYAVFPLDQPFWALAGLASAFTHPDGQRRLSIAIITVDPNRVLQSVGHHRSPAILRDPMEVNAWLHGDSRQALELLRPYPDESMGVEAVDMGIKIPGNQSVSMPPALSRTQGDS